MKLEYGHGCAAAMLDLRTQQVVTVGPQAQLPEEYEGKQYYQSCSGLSGAWRLPSRPYLRALRVFRDIIDELPTPECFRRDEGFTEDFTPFVPVDRSHGRGDLPYIHDVVATTSDGLLIAINMSNDLSESEWIEALSTSVASTRIGEDAPEIPEMRLIIYTHGTDTLSYEWRRLAWRIARRWFAEQTTTPTEQLAPSSAEYGECCSSPFGIERRLDGTYIARDELGVPVAAFSEAFDLREWLSDEPDHHGMGVLSTDGEDLYVDRTGRAWRLASESGMFELLPGTVDWANGTVIPPPSKEGGK